MNPQKAGMLFPMGGELDLGGACIQHFCEWAGGKQARILVIPTASEVADGGMEYPHAFSQFGCTHVQVLALREPPFVFDEHLEAAFETATGIFISGGNQVKLVSQLSLTPIVQALHNAYQRGVVIAGTSAGASAMSRQMLADGESGLMPKYGMVQFATGFGLTEQLMIDQHFGAWNRLGRLLVAMSLNPTLLGVGIDEDTGLEIYADGTMHIVGSGSVMILDARHVTHNTVYQLQPHDRLTLSDVQLHVLTSGWAYNYATHTTQFIKKDSP